MDKIFRCIHVRKLFPSTAVRNFILGRKHTELSSRGCQLRKNLKVDFRWFTLSSSCLSEQCSDIKDGVGTELSEENGKSDELASRIAPYIELATNTEKTKKILMFLMDHHLAKLEGKPVPAELSVNDMKELLCLYSVSSRRRFLAFLHAREKAKLNEKRKKEIKRKDYEEWIKKRVTLKPSEHITYGIGNNTLILRARRKSMIRFYNQRLANSALYGEKLIVDLDYDSFMRREDSNDCSEQLLELYGVNRRNRNPYDLIFCNASYEDPTMNTLKNYMPNLHAPNNFIATTNLSYLDIFPKEKLVYITPYAREPMRTYDHNAIYIIGGLVDKVIKEPVVLAKVKKEGLKAVHFPYEDYIMWGRGSKSLPLNIIAEILLEMKNTGDWNKAFSFVPKNKRVKNLDLFDEF